MPVALIAFVLLAAPPAPGGSWLPTGGAGGHSPVFAMASGGDGALYAAGGGVVFRIVPGERWQVLGPYAPALHWTQGEDSIEATGAFPDAFIDAVERDATAAVEGAAGHELDDEQAFDEDFVAQLLGDYVEEADARTDSAYYVAGMVSSTRGVWLGTGGGLFWADPKGVVGPIGGVTGVRALTATTDGLVVATADALLRVDATGTPRPWRRTTIEQLTTFGGRIAFVADGVLWRDEGGPSPLRLAPPTGYPRLVVGGGAALWVTTGLALYRYRAGEWKLCPSVPETASRLFVDNDQVVVVTDQALYSTDGACEAFVRLPVPWPGGMRFTDARWFGGRLWAASTEGIFEWSDAGPKAHARLQVDGFRRALQRMPPFDELTAAAMRYQRIDPESADFGILPSLRMLLPDVRAVAWTQPQRVEQTPTTEVGSERLTTVPTDLQYQVMATWTLRFDGLAALFDPVDTDEETMVLDEVDNTEVGVEYDGESLYDESGDQVDVVFVDLDTEEEIDAASYAYERAARERRLVQRDRRQLIDRMRRLYRERMRVLYRLWIEDEGDEAALKAIVRLDEIDALLDAYTGGGFGRRMK